MSDEAREVEIRDNYIPGTRDFYSAKKPPCVLPSPVHFRKDFTETGIR